MKSLPTGTVTFLFTDIEGSTTLLQRLGDRRYAEVLAEHRRLLRDAFAKGSGQEIDTQGDAFLVAFSRARDAIATALAVQLALTEHAWPDGASLRVRMGLHTGEPISELGDYVGLDVHRAARICSAGHGGQILLSDAVSGLAARDLPLGVSLRDLGIHRLKDLQQPEHLFQVVHPDLPADFPSLKSLDARPNNLPIQLTSFIGREREIAEVRRLLGAARLVTLTGSGGAGKTRLALQVASDVVEDYPEGVWFVEFAPIADPALVPKTIASALNVPEQPGRDVIETLADALRPKALLVVLDNCEHVLMACGDLAVALLRACPQVRVLATSREGLGVPGETLRRVPSLLLPDARHLPPPDDLVQYEAVRLFVDRAKAIVPGFAVTRENAPAVDEVCQRLDGIPLAIELAAARVKVLTVEQIAARLDDRFRLLTGGSRTLLPRQQTLSATLDWSYDLLSDQERIALRRLSVFAGGWTLEAAEAVCSGNETQASDILDLLTRLADKSLVLVEAHGREARYRLLETVRQYASERLFEAGEAAEVRKQHRDWYLAWAEGLDSATIPIPMNVMIERWELDHDNVRAALTWSRADDDGAEAELRLAGALRSFWFESGHWDEGRRWLEDSLARNSQAPPSAVLRVLEGAMDFAWRQGDNERAASLAEKGLALSAEVRDERSSVGFLGRLSTVALRQGNLERASTLNKEALERARLLGDKPLIARFLGNHGVGLVITGHYDHAAAFLDEGLAVSREAASAGSALRLYHYEDARIFWLRGHGLIALRRCDYERAEVLYREGLTLAKTIGKGRHWMGEECLEGLAGAATGQGDFVRGARLFAAAETLRETLGRVRLPPFQADHEQRVDSTRAALGDAVFTAAWAEGRAMTLEQAVEYALADQTGWRNDP